MQPYWSQQYWNAFGQLMVFGMFMAMAGGLMAGFIRESPSSGEHHSSWLTPEQRKTLVEKYGTVATRFAEEMVKPGDFEAAERLAGAMYAKYREAFGF